MELILKKKNGDFVQTGLPIDLILHRVGVGKLKWPQPKRSCNGHNLKIIES